MVGVTLGVTPAQLDLWRSTVEFCGGRVAVDSIYAILHREGELLFPDAMFADLFADVGRRSVPPRIVAAVMVLQRIEGCSDREAVDRFAYDARWKYAAGGLDFDYPGFAHTVLVDMRARLAASDRPNRIFEVTLEAARQAGLVGRRRVLDSTALYDAVATMDTVTLIRSAIRGLLKTADAGLETTLRAVLRRDDDYVRAGKPSCDWDDETARGELVDALARDAHALLAVLDGRQVAEPVAQAAALLATMVGQDLDQDEAGMFRITPRVAKDRVISTVDPQARHGHKTSARGFDGYKGHVAVDPDSEVITATEVTAGNTGDAASAADLLAGDLVDAAAQEPLRVYGDSSYGAGQLLDTLEQAGAEAVCKVQPPPAVGGRFSKDAFTVDLDSAAVTCPAGQTAPLRLMNKQRPGSVASFGQACATCPLATRCTNSKTGRTVFVGPYEEQLARARAKQHDPDFQHDYRATRPKVERKIAHLTRRRHGGRRARVRGQVKLAADFALLAAAVNLARLAILGACHTSSGWVLPTNGQ
jgi:hypothetical protein